MEEQRIKLCVLLSALAGSVQTYQLQEATVYWDAAQKSVIMKEGVMEDEGGAYGYFNDSLILSGWGVLEIRAGYGEITQEDETTYFLAGYLEGYLTTGQMFSHYSNMYPQLIKDEKVLNPLKRFLSKQDQWAREQVKMRRSDPLWLHVGLILAQLDGLQAGAAHWAKSKHREPLSALEVQFLNSVGDLLDLVLALTPRSNSSTQSDTFRMPGMGHCTALIKVLPGFENVLFAHSSWYTYAATMRIYKHWDFRLSDTHAATGKMSFSSYPGFLMSLDDFYLLGSSLLMTQTTHSVFNASLFLQLSPHSLLAWHAWPTAWHAVAKSTYNSQYMVLDLSRVSLGRSIRPGALTVVEQIPGKVMYSDQTQALHRGYWPSYNVPFHAEIYNLSGDQARVSDLSSLKHIMRYNNYRRDPYTKGHPCKTICCRNDLRPRRPRPGGCYDTKVTDYQMALQLVAKAINGPTTQGGLRPFSWQPFNYTAHRGLPHTYNFTFVTMRPTLHPP
ncbi:hypothetical protein LDENG_00141020 [Lucifuga dentata]|nr:hypothetical protein LDENG_00141020 [Lucifuga dentata]